MPLLPIKAHRLFGVHPDRPETYRPRAFALERRAMTKGYIRLKTKRHWYRRLFGYR